MLIVHSDIIQAVDRGQLMALILLDLSSEFDTVDHDCLLSILCNQFSVDGSAASWFQSHLSERTQTFTARGSQSSPVELQCSVPQAGSDPVHWRMFKTYLTDIGMDLKKQLVRSLFLRDLSWVRSSSLPTWRMFKTYLTDIGSAVISSQMISKSTPTYRPVTRRLAVSGLLTASLNYSQDVRHVVYNWMRPRLNLFGLALDRTLTINDVMLQPKDVVRDLGVQLDSELTMKQRVSRVASTCFYHLCRFRQLKCHVTSDVMNHLVVAVILSRLDYCNSVLAGLPWSTVAPLQRVQNAATWLVLGLSPRDHVSQALVDLHWLPVRYQIQYKLALMMYMAHISQTTLYIKDAVTPITGTQLVTAYDSPTPLTTRYQEHKPSLARVFCVTGPSTWNSLPESLRTTDCTETFKRRLKLTFLTSTSALLCFNFSLFYWLL